MKNLRQNPESGSVSVLRSIRIRNTGYDHECIMQEWSTGSWFETLTILAPSWRRLRSRNMFVGALRRELFQSSGRILSGERPGGWPGLAGTRNPSTTGGTMYILRLRCTFYCHLRCTYVSNSWLREQSQWRSCSNRGLSCLKLSEVYRIFCFT